MSLINEALRRARKDGTLKDSGKELQSGTIRAGQRPESRLGTGLVLGACIAIAAAGFGAIAAFWFLNPSDTKPAITAKVDNQTSSPTVPEEELNSEVELRNPDTSGIDRFFEDSESSDSSPPRSRLNDAQQPARQQPEREHENPYPTPPRPLSAATQDQSSASSSSGGVPSADLPDQASAEREFIAEANLGYVSLRLDYIAFRETDPFAEINGLEVHVGSSIHGFIVEKIEKNFVLLSDEHGPLTLRVK